MGLALQEARAGLTGSIVSHVSVTDAPSAPERQQFTIEYTRTDDGWWAASIEGIVDVGVFGQGRTREEAKRNAGSALADLLYTPTPAMRFLFRWRRLMANLRDLLPAR
jgi:predicted RNase H-like HicB family nuclease